MKISKLINKKGIAVILAIFVVTVLTILAVGVIYRAQVEYDMARRNKLSTEALYLAEAGVEEASYRLGDKIANFEPEPVNVGDAWDVIGSGGSINNYLSTDFDLTYECILESLDNIVVDSQGIVSLERLYKISATATHPESGVAATVNQMIGRNMTHAFQYAVFYADDLELLPGPDMTLSGRIHSNGDIYVDCNNTLIVDSEYFHSAGSIFNKRKDDGDHRPGRVSIKEAGSSNYEYMDPNGGSPEFYDSEYPDWADEALDRWNGTVQSSVHGVTARVAPSVGSIQTNGYYAQNADIYIENNNIYAGGPPSGGGVQLVEGVDIPIGTVTSSTSFYNNREGKWVKMTEIDLDKLGGGDFDGTTYGNNLPSNGLMYATRDDISSGQQEGIRLKEGSEIKQSAGLTMVSNAPVYIQGDYNTLDKKPAAVICDSVNLLSNNWNDSNSTNNVDNRVASNTNINTAFIAGIDTTTPGNYNGGVENYPRMHENWTGRTLQIRGSFVALWNSQVAQGEWVYGNPQYKAPNRDWDYDNTFNNVSNLPPFTPFAVETERKVWW